MKTYKILSPGKAYHLINTGAMLVLSTVSSDGIYNMAPIAWHCPVDYDPVTRMAFVSDAGHKTLKNIKETSKFIACLPHLSQLKLVKELGDISGHSVNKMEKLKLDVIKGEKVDCLILPDCIGYIECTVYRMVDDKEVVMVFGEAVHAAVDENAYSGRLLTENAEGKAIYHLGGKVFTTAGNEISS